MKCIHQESVWNFDSFPLFRFSFRFTVRLSFRTELGSVVYRVLKPCDGEDWKDEIGCKSGIDAAIPLMRDVVQKCIDQKCVNTVSGVQAKMESPSGYTECEDLEGPELNQEEEDHFHCLNTPIKACLDQGGLC